MKKIYIIPAIIVLMGASFTSCKKLLEVTLNRKLPSRFTLKTKPILNHM
jgi:hypothetical protein